jgi:hypothetical protein
MKVKGKLDDVMWNGLNFSNLTDLERFVHEEMSSPVVGWTPIASISEEDRNIFFKQHLAACSR